MIRISIRDSFADLPPSVLKKKIQEIDKKEEGMTKKKEVYTFPSSMSYRESDVSMKEALGKYEVIGSTDDVIFIKNETYPSFLGWTLFVADKNCKDDISEHIKNNLKNLLDSGKIINLKNGEIVLDNGHVYDMLSPYAFSETDTYDKKIIYLKNLKRIK